MTRSIQEIKRLRDLGRMKWGKSLIEFLKPYVDDGFTNQDMVEMLSADFDLHITVNALKNLRFNYKKKIQITDPVKPVPVSSQRSTYESIFGNKIVQKQDSEKTVFMTDSDIDACCDDDIVAKQKRDRENFLNTNLRGAKL